MAEPAGASVGGVDVALRAPLDLLEQDLARARQAFNQFDRAATTQSMDKWADVSKKVDKAFGSLEDQLKGTRGAQNDFTASSEQTTAALTKQNAVLSQATDRYKSYSNAANDNTAAANDNATSLADVASGAHMAVKGLEAAAIGALVFSSRARAMALATGMAGASGALGLLGRGIVAVLPLLGPLAAGAAVVATFAKAFERAGEKIEEFVKLAQSAGSSEVSLEWLQQIRKGAGGVSTDIDSINKALDNFAKQAQERLGGSAIEKRLDELVEAGNFASNAWVKAYKEAATAKDQFIAITGLITTAIKQRERLAALDLAEKFLPPDMLTKLRASDTYLQDILDKSLEVTRVDLIKEQDIARAEALKKRLDDAYNALSVQWKPFDELLTNLGMELKTIWAGILETIGEILNLAPKAAAAASKYLSSYESPLAGPESPDSGQGFRSRARRARENLRSSLDEQYGMNSPAAAARLPVTPMGFSEAWKEFPESMNVVNRTAEDTDGVFKRLGLTMVASSNALDENKRKWKELGDVSKPVTAAANETKDAWDRAVESIGRHTAAMQANAISVGMGEGAQAGLRAEFQLLEAARQADRGVTYEQIAAYTQLRKEMSAEEALAGAGIKLNDNMAASFTNLTMGARAAAEAYAQLRAESKANFELQTVGLSGIEKEIAAINFQLHGNKWQDFMNDGLSATMRLTDELRNLKSATDGFGQSLLSNLLNGQKGFEALTGAAKQMISQLASDTLKRVQGGGSFFGGQSLMSAGGALGMASAGLAGYQSGSPLIGALGGAMAGAAFGPAGAVAGGIIGAIGGIFGGNAQKKQAEAQRRAEEAARAAQGALRAQQIALETTLIGVDTSTRAGALQQLATQHTLDMAQEAQQGNYAAAALEAKYQAQRIDIIKQGNKKALEVLAPEEGLTQVAQRFKDINEAGEQLSSGLKMLGQSAAEVSAKVAASIGKLRTDFVDELERSVNSATGRGYLNDLKDLVEGTAKTRADAALLGNVDTTLIDRLFAAQAQSIIDNAGLVGTAFEDLLAVFPNLASIVHESTSALQQQTEAQEAARKSIQDYLDSLMFGTTSTLSQADQLGAAQALFNQQLATASGTGPGAEDARREITQSADRLLQIAREFLGPSTQYGSLFDDITQQLRTLQSMLGSGEGGGSALVSQPLFAAFNEGGLSSSTGTAGVSSMVSGTSTSVRSGSSEVVGAITDLRNMMLRAMETLSIIEREQTDVTREVSAGIEGLRTDQKLAAREYNIRETTAA